MCVSENSGTSERVRALDDAGCRRSTCTAGRTFQSSSQRDRERILYSRPTAQQAQPPPARARTPSSSSNDLKHPRPAQRPPRPRSWVASRSQERPRPLGPALLPPHRRPRAVLPVPGPAPPRQARPQRRKAQAQEPAAQGRAARCSRRARQLQAPPGSTRGARSRSRRRRLLLRLRRRRAWGEPRRSARAGASGRA